MKLLTKEIISKFESHPIGSQDGKGLEAEVLVKYFNPCGAGTWLITEAEREGDDWHPFVCRSDLQSNATFTRPGNTSGTFCPRINDDKVFGFLPNPCR